MSLIDVTALVALGWGVALVLALQWRIELHQARKHIRKLNDRIQVYHDGAGESLKLLARCEPLLAKFGGTFASAQAALDMKATGNFSDEEADECVELVATLRASLSQP